MKIEFGFTGCLVLLLTIVVFFTEVSICGDLVVNIQTSENYSDLVSESSGSIITVEIPKELKDKEIDRAYLRIYPSAGSTTSSGVKLACYQVLPPLVGSSPAITSELPEIEESALGISEIPDETSEGWLVDITTILSEQITESKESISFLIIGLFDSDLDFNLSSGSGGLPTGSVAQLVIHYSNMHPVPMPENKQ